MKVEIRNNTKPKKYFQDYMGPNVCYGCGKDNDKGLQIQSYWEGDEAICEWQGEEHHHGWPTIMNGGIMATLIDCHCMCTAMAHAHKEEGRSMDSQPIYRFVTGTMNIRYMKPTSNLSPVRLVAKVIESKGRKVSLICTFFSEGVKTAEAEVIAIRVLDSSEGKEAVWSKE